MSSDAPEKQHHTFEDVRKLAAQLKESILNEEKSHHPFSPSKLQALEFCPCYASNDVAHVKAAIGTLQHRVTETAEDDLRLSDDEAAAAAECLDFVERQKVLLNEARNREVVAGAREYKSGREVPPVLELTEIYLPVDALVFSWRGESYQGTTGGWLDRVLLSHDRTLAIACDWKFGLWPVDAAPENLQGICYALGIFLAYPEVEMVRFYFKQPHLGLLTSAVWVRADIPRLYTRVMVVVLRAVEAQQGETPDWSKANPGFPVCLFCGNIGRCDKVAQMALKVSKKFYPAGVPDDITPTSITSPAEAKARLHIAGILQVWTKAIRRQETDLTLRSGRIPEGFKVDSRTPREIADKAKFKEVALRSLTESEFESTLDYEFGKVETLVKDKAPRGQKKAALESLDREWREAGAVKDGQPYAFLRSIPADEK